MTCCALHNWLLKIDGTDAQWNNGVESDWEGNKIGGEFEYKGGDDKGNSSTNDDDVTIDTTTVAAGANRTANDVPNTVYRILNPVVQCDGVSSSCKNVLDDDESDDVEIDVVKEEEESEVLSLDFLRSKLVTHFDNTFKRNEVVGKVAATNEEEATSDESRLGSRIK